MRQYRSGGTPWAVIIDTSGKVVFNDFHIEVADASSVIDGLIPGQTEMENRPGVVLSE